MLSRVKNMVIMILLRLFVVLLIWVRILVMVGFLFEIWLISLFRVVVRMFVIVLLIVYLMIEFVVSC